ncbi:MAG TPA: RlmE family RNA methyltransferase [Aestuariivirgaceae bacterium]|jgi:23S rRNA (uridine2552-2'-O)-methyltransferase
MARREAQRSAGRPLKVRLRKGKGRTPSQKHWLERQLNDPLVREAREQGLRARSAFKLSEIDDKHRIFRPGMRVVDLGAAPGSWSQIAAHRVRAKEGHGRIVALDIHAMEPLAGVTSLRKDFLDEDAPDLLKQALHGELADVVLSDMAGHATGHRQTDHLRIMALCAAALEFARDVLKPGGTFLCKVLRGGTEQELLADLKRDFAAVRHVKPAASRADSAELFVLATGFRGG